MSTSALQSASASAPAQRKSAGAAVIVALAISFIVLASLTWAAFAPIESASREAVFEIPKGTWAQRMSGSPVDILPDEIRLTLGVRDVLVLKNSDDVPQMFGPTLMMPGQSLRLPFTQVSSTDFACTAHASGQMTITVEAFPNNPWARLRWRLLDASAKTTRRQEQPSAPVAAHG